MYLFALQRKLKNQFSVDVFQGKADTSTNMNMNEVLANRGFRVDGHSRGAYSYLHPNDDVNLSQSTHDAYPTAVRVSVLLVCGGLSWRWSDWPPRSSARAKGSPKWSSSAVPRCKTLLHACEKHLSGSLTLCLREPLRSSALRNEEGDRGHRRPRNSRRERQRSYSHCQRGRDRQL